MAIGCVVGRETGFEPATTGITIRGSIIRSAHKLYNILLYHQLSRSAQHPNPLRE